MEMSNIRPDSINVEDALQEWGSYARRNPVASVMQPRRTVGSRGLAFSMVAIVGIVGVILGLGYLHDAAPKPHISSTPGELSLAGQAAAGPGMRAVVFHAISLQVPRQWRSAPAESVCSSPNDTVSLPGVGCLEGSRGIAPTDQVRFLEGTNTASKSSGKSKIGGLAVQRYDKQNATSYTITIAFPRLDATLEIERGSKEAAQAMARSVRVVAFDSNGCPTVYAGLGALRGFKPQRVTFGSAGADSSSAAVPAATVCR